MSRYTFTCEHFSYNNFTGDEENITTKHTTQFRADDLTTMLENFESFLRGSGFNFDGVLDIVPIDEGNSFEEEESTEPGDNSSRVVSWMVDDLLKNIKTEAIESTDPVNCPLCNLPKNVMEAHACWDPKCPIQETKRFASEK
jgi:hypothetical protein